MANIKKIIDRLAKKKTSITNNLSHTPSLKRKWVPYLTPVNCHEHFEYEKCELVI
jgi:hypothetical protein